MTFFSDGNQEYFSLSLNPSGSKKAYVFPLTKRQHSVSRLAPYLLLASVLILAGVTFFAVSAHLGPVGASPAGSSPEAVVVTLSVAAAIIAFAELAFFLWLRPSRLSESSRRVLRLTRLLKRRSWMVYLTFLFSLAAPIVGLIGLPGALAEVFSGGGNAWLFLLAQLALVMLAMLVFLLRRIAVLLLGPELYANDLK
jgi:hypothetical protein